MKKKFLYGALAAVLVAVNVLAFSTFKASAKVIYVGPYQTIAYCSEWTMKKSCTSSPTAWSCTNHCGKPTNLTAPGGRQ